MNMIPVLSAVLFSVCMAGVAGAQQVGNPEWGREAAVRYCSDCHAVQPGTGPSPDPRAPSFMAAANIKGMSRIALAVWLRTGHPTMPNILLKADTSDDIIAYILSLQAKSPE